MADITITKILLTFIVRFILVNLAFGLVYFIDKFSKTGNEWDLRYVLVVSFFSAVFMTIFYLFGV
jgi:small neutral amino acid transporter SnatA (MarC family)